MTQTFVDDVFGGMLVSTVQCTECGNVSPVCVVDDSAECGNISLSLVVSNLLILTLNFCLCCIVDDVVFRGQHCAVC